MSAASSDRPPSGPSSGGMSSGRSPDPVHFEGPWTEDEMRVVERAAATAEAAGLPPVRSELGRPWIAVKHDVGPRLLFVASRPHVERTLVASNAQTLAERIEAIGSPPPE